MSTEDVSRIVDRGRCDLHEPPTDEVLQSLREAYTQAPDLLLKIWWRPEDGRLDFLGDLPATRLELEGFPVALPELPLRDLSIRGCWEEPYDLEVIAPISTLETLYLDCRGRTGNLKPLRDHPTLRNLTVGGKVSGFGHIGSLTRLRRLVLNATPKKGVAGLGALPPLESLTISRRTTVGLDGIELLADSLRRLVLTYLRNEASVIEGAISSLPGIQDLALGSLPHLHHLRALRGTGIRSLYLGDLPLGSLEQLAELPELRELCLGTLPSNVDLEPLLSCERLWKVRFYRASDRAIESIAGKLHQRSVKVLRGHN